MSSHIDLTPIYILVYLPLATYVSSPPVRDTLPSYFLLRMCFLILGPPST